MVILISFKIHVRLEDFKRFLLHGPRHAGNNCLEVQRNYP